MYYVLNFLVYAIKVFYLSRHQMKVSNPFCANANACFNFVLKAHDDERWQRLAETHFIPIYLTRVIKLTILCNDNVACSRRRKGEAFM